MKLHLVSLGCARNQVDSEIMLGRLREQGWTITPDPEEARVIIVNTCSFIEPAVNESIDTILAMSRYKEEGECKRLIVVGCLPQRYQEEILPTLPEVDLFLGTGAFDQIEQAVREAEPRGCFLPSPEKALLEPGDTPRLLTDSHSAYLKIAEGCDSKCTYCIIPKLRGGHRSRPAADILTEAKHLIAQGVKELVLVAQDTTHYGQDLSPKSSLSALLRELGTLSDQIWVRFLYGHPEHFDAALPEAIAAFPSLCPYFDFPIQHASDRVLKRMGRRYDRKKLSQIFSRIREHLPEAALRTSVIVGFPGETDEDIKVLLEFMAEVKFDHLGVFVYSDSDDLPSHNLSDHIPAPLARKRYNQVMRKQKSISKARAHRHLGKTMTVLVEQELEEGLFGARTIFQAPEVDGMTFVQSDRAIPVGEFLRVKVTDTTEYDLTAEPET